MGKTLANKPPTKIPIAIYFTGVPSDCLGGAGQINCTFLLSGRAVSTTVGMHGESSLAET